MSYEWLGNDTLRFCFLYCSLYPEGYSIDVNELVQCWVAANVIDEQLYYENALHKGLDLIKEISKSCLLEEAYYLDGLRKVKVHDMVCDFARWIVRLRVNLSFSLDMEV